MCHQPSMHTIALSSTVFLTRVLLTPIRHSLPRPRERGGTERARNRDGSSRGRSGRGGIGVRVASCRARVSSDGYTSARKQHRYSNVSNIPLSLSWFFPFRGVVHEIIIIITMMSYCITTRCHACVQPTKNGVGWEIMATLHPLSNPSAHPPSMQSSSSCHHVPGRSGSHHARRTCGTVLHAMGTFPGYFCLSTASCREGCSG